MTPPPGGPAATGPGVVVRAGAADLDILSQVIAEAFHDLAPTRWLIDDPAARREIFPGYFRILAEHALAAGVIHTTPGRTAAALWIPVSADGPAPPLDYGARLAAATSPWTGRFLAFDAALDRHHPIGVPHHHLAILAVSPQRQGQGTGTALLRAYHQFLDHDAGVPAYLEASDLRTRQIYLRYGGYTDHGPPIQLPGDGPLMYPLWRECRPAAATAGGQGQQIPPLPRRIPIRRHPTMHPADSRPHPAPSSGQDAALDRLAAELRARGCRAHLIAPAGSPPSLAVTSPHATTLTGTVMADATSYWWPWADRIAAVADVAGAADVITRVLASVPGDGQP
jgi:GNAT superfamily N-acetyltransferase